MTRTVTHRGREYVVSAAHPAAEAFPWMSEDEIDALADDLRANPQRFKIRVQSSSDLVFDGRNRELACRIAGVEPQYAYEDMTDAEVCEFVASANLHRRNLTPAQRAACAAELARLQGKSPAQVADQFDVSERAVRYAAEVRREDPALFAAVKAGDLPVRVAAAALELPAEKREEIVSAPVPEKAARAAILDALAEEGQEWEESAPVPDDNHVFQFRPRTPDELQRDVDDARQVNDGLNARMRDRQEAAAWRKSLKPGNNADPDHPYAKTLKAMTALVKAIHEDMAGDNGKFLRANLFLFSKIKAPLKMVYHRNGYERDDGTYVEARDRFIGLQLLRAVVRDTGKRLKEFTPKQIARLVSDIENADPAQLMDKEDVE